LKSYGIKHQGATFEKSLVQSFIKAQEKSAEYLFFLNFLWLLSFFQEKESDNNQPIIFAAIKKRT
jgi:hypothetical protein